MAPRRVTSDAPKDAPAEALAAAGLGHVALGRRTRTLSGGERQRLALAVAVAAEPKDALVLLDEPAAGLADSDIAALVETLRDLAKAGNLVVLASDRDVLTGAQSSFGTNSSWIDPQGTVNSAASMPPSTAPRIR